MHVEYVLTAAGANVVRLRECFPPAHPVPATATEHRPSDRQLIAKIANGIPNSSRAVLFTALVFLPGIQALVTPG